MNECDTVVILFTFKISIINVSKFYFVFTRKLQQRIYINANIL